MRNLILNAVVVFFLNNAAQAQDGSITIRKKNKDSKSVQEVSDSTRTVYKDPIVKFAGMETGSIIRKEELLENPVLTAEFPEMEGKEALIISFDISAAFDGYEQTVSSVSGDTTEKQKALLNRLKSGSKLYVESIYVKWPDGKARVVSPISLKVL